VNIAIALVAGLFFVVLILQDAFEVMLLPRRVQRRWRFVRFYFRGTWALWCRLARIRSAGAARERFLSIYGPLSMAVLFAIWAVGLIVSFALLQWAIQSISSRSPLNLGDQLYMSGVTFFTLGYGDVVPTTALSRFVAVLEAGAGFALIAVVIGYLPVLYQLFSRREAHVIQLDARAGSPPTATSMLQRHAESDGLEKIDDLLRAWEVWGADLLESHLSYPMLAYYRSQHDDQSWLGALLAIMDTCALILVGVEDIKPLQARMTFAMARQVVLEMARSLGVSAPSIAEPDRLGQADYAKMITIFEEVGLRWNGGSGSPKTLAAIRATYEPLAQGLGAYLLIPLPGWVAGENASDHWERGPRGIIARRLVDSLASGSITPEQSRSRRSLLGRVRDGRR
jgi:voltage-gated potassium channel Kch